MKTALEVKVKGALLPMTVLETVKAPVSERQKEVFELIDKEDFGNVKRKVKHEFQQYGIEADENYLNEGILSLKQYYAICFMDDNPHAISDALDPFWHAHILHTIDYHQFCAKLDIDYMHHVPNNPDDSEESEKLRVIYDHTQNVYEKCFSWISPTFNDVNVPAEKLVCTHYTQKRFVKEGDFAFERQQHLCDLQQSIKPFLN